MLPERWQQIKDIFHEALERPPGERAAFVEEACAGDEEARREVLSLLGAHEETGEFLDVPAYELATGAGGSRPTARLESGRAVAHYRIVDLIGEGGMGRVYLAEDTRLGRRIALKFLPSSYTRDEDRVRRFRQEARAASALSHPNVAVIHEIGETDEGLHFIAMEYVEGETLRERLRRGPLSVREALDVSAQVASALAAAHKAGVIHRDIKPENVMLGEGGLVKVLDFGIAKLAERAGADADALTRSYVQTGSGVLVGTAGYMSPEQARGQKVDERTDIWSLGCVLYECVAGRAPFAADNPGDALVAALERDPAPLSRLAGEVPTELERIVRKSLQKERAERYQTARDMELDFKALRRELEIGAELERSAPPDAARITDGASALRAARETGAAQRRTTLDEESIDVSEKKRTRTVLFVALAALVVALAAGGFWLYKSASSGNSEPLAARVFRHTRVTKLTTNGNAFVAAISPDGRHVAYIMNEAGGQSLWVRQVATAGNVQITKPGALGFLGLSFSRDGDYIYFVGGDSSGPPSLYRVPTLGQGTAPVRLIANVQSGVGLSPDGTRVVFVRNDINTRESWLIIARTDGTGEEKLVTRKLPDDIAWSSTPVWSPDGRVIVSPVIVNTDDAGPYESIIEVRLADRSERFITERRWELMGRVEWLTDGSGLLFTAKEKNQSYFQIYVLSYPDGTARRVTSDLIDYRDIGVTADGTALVSVQGQTLSNLWAAPGGDSSRASQVTRGAGRYFDIDWARDGRIVYASDASGSAEIWEMEADGAGQRQLTIGAGKNYAPSVSPDGRFIVFHSNRSGGWQIWRMDRDGNNPRQLTSGPFECNFPVTSSDGRWVYFHYRGRGVLAAVGRVPIDGGEVERLTDKQSLRPAPSPDGRWVAFWQGDDSPSPTARIALMSAEDKRTERFLDVPQAVPDWDIALRWTPDARSLTYRYDRDGVTNIWAQPLAGGPPRQLTTFQSERIFDHAWSTDGRLLLSRGVETNDVVLMTSVEDN